MTRIAVIGANGSIGRGIVSEALARGHEVTAVVRDPAKYRGEATVVVRGDVLDPADVARVAAGQDVLVSAVGGGQAPGRVPLVEAAARTLIEGLRSLGSGAPRLIAVGEAPAFYGTVSDISWTVSGPAAATERIDFAVALIDEIEQPEHIGEQFTCGG